MPLDIPLKQAIRSTRWRIALLVAALALAATFLLGGFRQAPPKRVPQAGVGEPFASDALSVRALGAWTDVENPRGYADSIGGQHFLVLDAVVENLTDSSSNYYLSQDLRWLASQADLEGRQADAVYLADDMTLHDFLHPRMATHVLMAWKIKPGQVLETPLRFGLYQRRFVAKAYVSNESGWIQDGPAVTLKLAFEDRRAEAAP